MIVIDSCFVFTLNDRNEFSTRVEVHAERDTCKTGDEALVLMVLHKNEEF